MSSKPPIPNFKTDEEAADFVAKADLTRYDLKGGQRVRYEIGKKDNPAARPPRK